MASSGERTGSADLSWDRGPDGFRPVRLLYYPSMGLLGGLILGFVALFGPDFLSRLSGDVPPWLVLGLVVAVVFFAPFLWAGVHTNRVQRERFRLAREWHAVMVSRWSLVSALLFGGLFAGTGLAFDWSLETYLGVGYAGLLVGTVLTLLAGFLGSAGGIDPESLTLSYAGRDDVDLRRLQDLKRLSVGPYTVLWLLFSPATGNRRSGQGLYAVPTAVVERAWPVFERGMAADAGSGKREKSQLLRRINVVVSVVFVGASAGVLAFLVWMGSPAWQLAQWLWITGGVGYLFGRFLVRTF